MRSSFIKILLAGTATMVAGLATAQSQSFDMWFNVTGNTAHASTINAVAGSTLNLTVYYQTANVGGASQVGGLLGFGSSTSSGTGASSTDTRLTYHAGSFAYGSGFGSFDVANGLAGGSGPSAGTARAYGYYADTFTNSTLPNADGTPTAYYSLTLDVSAAAAGQSIVVPIFADTIDTNPGAYSSYLFTAAGAALKPTGFSATINVSAVPEPATFAVFGLGALAFLRRRRRS